MRYRTRFGCRFGLPHDMKILYQDLGVKWEVCKICSKKFRWKQGYRGRINNVAYLEAHVRNYAQKFGATRRVYYKVNSPEKLKIII